jgi:hypothetical protein
VSQVVSVQKVARALQADDAPYPLPSFPSARFDKPDWEIEDHGMEITANGFLRDPHLHDGHLIGLELIEKAILRIRLRDLAGNQFVMELSGLKRLLGNEFREGNIILDIRIACGIPPDESHIRDLMGEPHKGVGTYRERQEAHIQQQVQDVAKGKLALVSIDSSYGCVLTALCEAVCVRRE